MKNMISRRNFLAAAGVVAAAGVLTACGGSSSSTAASAAGSAAASGDTIKIGVMGPLTGNVSVYGQAVVNGAALYLKQVNADGGINGKQIEILTEDEQGDATQAVNCFTKMVDEGITALVGDVTTTPTLAVAAESADYNMPMVTASATAEAVTYDAETDTVNANVFRATFTDPFQGIKMADYAYQKLGYTKAAVIFKKGADYNEGLAENFKGDTAVAFAHEEDPMSAARILCKYQDGDKSKKFVVKAGFMEGKAMNAAETNAIAKLPNREGMLSMFAGALTSTLSGLAVAMQAYADKQEEPAA